MFKFENIKIQGVIFIEVMLTIVLSSLLLLILFKLYTASVENREWQHSLQEITDNIEVVTNVISNEIREAGYIGCAKLTADFPLISHVTNINLTPQNQLVGKESEFIIRRADIEHASLAESSTRNNILSVTKNIHFAAGDVVMISDCKHAEIIKIEKINTTKNYQQLFLSDHLQYFYGLHAEVSKFIINKYFIAKASSKNAKASLFVENIHHRKSKLIEGVDGIHFLYAVVEDKNIIDKDAEEIDDWSQVVGVSTDVNFSTAKISKNWEFYAARE